MSAFVACAMTAGQALAGQQSAEKPALSDYFPTAESHGGWRSLLPETGSPTAADKARIRELTGVDWDKLATAWAFNAAIEGPSTVLVIRRGYIVGEWYKDCNRSTPFNIFSSSKSYTSMAFGLLLADSAAGRLPGKPKLTRDTRVCNPEWLPQSLPLSDTRRERITLDHLLHMTSGLGARGVGEKLPEKTPFEWAFGHVPGSPMTTLSGEPGTVFAYSNGNVAHLPVLFHNVSEEDLFPFLKRRVFDPIGIEQIRWDQIGGQGQIGPLSQAFSGIRTTPRQHARFCYLALHRGQWAGNQILPKDYFDWAWRGSEVQSDYAALWWVSPHRREAPPDMVQTLGHASNNGYIIPSLDLVVVRLGTSDKLPPNSKPFDQQFTKLVLAAVQ